MQITPVSYNYTNQLQNNQQSFGMATTTRMRSAITNNVAGILSAAAEGETKLIRQLHYIEEHPLMVGWTGDTTVIICKGSPMCRRVETATGGSFADTIDRTVNDLQTYSILARNAVASTEIKEALRKQLIKARGEETRYMQRVARRISKGQLGDKEDIVRANEELKLRREKESALKGQKSNAEATERDTYARLDDFFPGKTLPREY